MVKMIVEQARQQLSNAHLKLFILVVCVYAVLHIYSECFVSKLYKRTCNVCYLTVSWDRKKTKTPTFIYLFYMFHYIMK